jgi:hypothetical protein
MDGTNLHVQQAVLPFTPIQKPESILPKNVRAEQHVTEVLERRATRLAAE